MNREQIQHVRRTLGIGVGLVKDPRYPEPFLIDIPYIALDKNVGDDEVLDRLTDMADCLYHVSEVTEIREAIRLYRKIPAQAVALLEPPNVTQPTSEAKVRPQSDRTGSAPVPEELLNVVRFIVARKEPALPQTQLLNACGISGGSRQIRAKRQLISLGLVNEHTLSKGKARLIFLEPTHKALGLLGCPIPNNVSNPGFLHNVVNEHIESYARKQGYRVSHEWLLSNGCRVDLMLQRDEPHETVFAEIGMSSAKNELNNVANDLSSEQIPDRLIVACKDTKMKNTLTKLVEQELTLQQYIDRIQVALAGDFIEVRK